MPGHSKGAPHKPRLHTHHTGQSRAEGYRQGRIPSRDSNASQESYRDPHGYGSHPKAHHGRKTSTHHTNGRGSETLGFVPGSADSPQGQRSCGSCSSLGWSSCRALLCCILTCGFYGGREPCLPANESSTDHPAKAEPESRTLATAKPSYCVPPETGKSRLPANDSFRYKDVRIAGKKVVYPSNAAPPPRQSRASGKGDGLRPVSNTSLYSRENLDLDELSDGGTDIDSLITKKLLELYALHQIDQLAKCTSDTSFSRKTNEISDLIYSIAQDYNLEEQEAECRLVHGVIRISTRKRSKGSHAPPQQANGTLPDSGNETMTYTFASSDMEPEVKVSELTPSDELARKMRVHSGRYSSSRSVGVYSPYRHDTDTLSSGAPLLHVV